jgi:AMP-polyphosphate phosphotransferase
MRLEDFEDWPAVADEAAYKAEIERLHLRALTVQQHLHRHKRNAVVVFEGWDAAGKGGAIRRLCTTLDPRGYAVHAVGPPSEDELEHHYLWRFWRDLPGQGQLAIFDRSWYGRVLVERVDQLTPKHIWQRAYDEINEFEKLLVNDGTPVVKFYLHISKHEQAKRFEERKDNPLKSWKLTHADWKAHEQYAAYYEAVNDMLARTHTAISPWTVVSANRKWHARLQVMETFCSALEQATGEGHARARSVAA